jgi:hypothetical protein
MRCHRQCEGVAATTELDFQKGRLKQLKGKASERGKHILFVDALVRGHQPQDAVEGANTQGGVIWLNCKEGQSIELVLHV